MWHRHIGLIAAVAGTIGLAGCLESAPRKALPGEFIETATIPGYETVRGWGDEVSDGFTQAIIRKDEQVRDAADAGRTPLGRKKADFLAISGGGDNGGFAAGVLTGWTERGDRPEFEAVTGVSAGALAAPFAFLGSSYDHALRDIYTKMSAGSLYTSRGPLGYFKDAINDTSRLRKSIEGYATDAFLDKIAAGYANGRRILILTTNLDAERPVIWDLTAIAATKRPDRRKMFVNVLLASSAVPGIFPPVHFDVVDKAGHHYDEMHVDGGVTAQLVFVPPEMNLLKIEDSVFGARRTRSLYIIRNGKIEPEYAASETRAISIASRAVATLVKYQVISDLARLKKLTAMNNTAFNFCATPDKFSAVAAVDFDTDYATKLFDVGVAVGKKGLWSSEPPSSPERYMP